MSNPASVISIATRAAFRGNYRGQAADRLRRARETTGLDPEGFADYLSGLVDWDIDPDLIRPWEAGDGTVPGDVVVAAEQLLSGEPPAPVSVLGSVPGGFPAQALAGHWLTCYGFTHNGAIRYHADVARVTAESDRRVTVTNCPPEPRTEGRESSPFRNEIEAELVSRHLLGRWKNVSDTRYFGSLQLAVMPGETIMDGWYLGFASDIAVSFARWKWVRLADGIMPDVSLRKPAELHALVAGRSPYDPPLAVDEIGEEA